MGSGEGRGEGRVIGGLTRNLRAITILTEGSERKPVMTPASITGAELCARARRGLQVARCDLILFRQLPHRATH